MTCPDPINRARLVGDLAGMIQIPSINPFGQAGAHTAEAEMADDFETRLHGLGLQIGTAQVSAGRRNVWGTLRGTGGGPTILLAGHLDTVGVEGYTDPFNPKIADGKIHGRGSCDMKAGLAAYLEVVRVLQETGPLKGDVIVAGVVDEEHAMTGSYAFGKNGPPVDHAIVAEPTQLAICPTHKGQILMTLRCQGLAAHSSLPQNGKNAIYHMATLLSHLQSYAHQLSKRTPEPDCGSPSFSVGVVRGGDNACSVPDFCEIDVDRRTIPGESFGTVMSEIQTVIHAAKQAEPDLQIEVLPPFLNLPPLGTAPDAPLMGAITSACQKVTGQCPVHAFPGSTDAPNFGCPTVICGPGDLAQCHSLDEYVEISQIEDAVRIYLNTIRALQPD